MPKEILIVVEGGIVQEVYGIQPGVVVRIKDYDVDPHDNPDYPRDRDGEAYCESIWAADDSRGPVNA